MKDMIADVSVGNEKVFPKFEGSPIMSKKESSKRLSSKKKKQIKLFLMLLPFLVLVVLFAYVPLFGWFYAFLDYIPGLPLYEQTFVGLKYFKIIFSGGSDFGKVMVNTLGISFLSLACSVIPVIFAILISQVRSVKFSKLVQTLTSLPNFISWVLVYSIVFSFFSPNDGMVNNILMRLSIINQPISVLANKDAAWYVQTLIGVWKGTGWGAIIYLAAITGIDQELYDAGNVDGANRWQEIIHITVPGVLPTYLVLFLLSVSSILSNGFDQYWVFQNSLTIDKLEVFDTYVYRLGMINMQYAFSTAMGIFKTLISVLLLTIANFVSKSIRGEYIV